MKKYLSLSLLLILIVFLWEPLGTIGANGLENKYQKIDAQDAKSRLVYNEVNGDNIKGTIEKLEQYGERFSRDKQFEAIAWGRSQFENLGLKCWVETYRYNDKIWPNLFARVEGRRSPSDLVMVIAHIDSKSHNIEKGAPGADDNGSGVAVLFELARILSQYPLETSVQFCLFTNEEQGQEGSKAFARKARIGGQGIKAVINLDILGYNRSFDWHALWLNDSFRGIVKTLHLMVQNVLIWISEGKDVLIVAGRPANGKLVTIVGDKVREGSGGITVKRIISADCA